MKLDPDMLQNKYKNTQQNPISSLALTLNFKKISLHELIY